MPQITLDMADAAELAEMLTFLTGWLSGSQKQILAGSFAALIGHPAYNTGTQFLPILTCQRDHARDHGQAARAALFDGLIQRAETTQES